MSIMMNNADGSQSEVFTKTEMDTAKTQATEAATKAATEVSTKLVEEKIEEFKKANPSGAEEIETLKKDLETKVGEIKTLEDAAKGEGDGGAGAGAGDGEDSEQIKRLRKEKDELKEDFDKKFDAMGEQLKTVIGDAKTDLIKKVLDGASESDVEAAGGKEEFQKKIELKYDSFKEEAVSPQQIAERVAESVTLVTGNKPAESIMDGATGAGGKGDEDHGAGQPKEVSDTAKKVGTGLGITDEDRALYGPGGDKHKSSGEQN